MNYDRVENISIVDSGDFRVNKWTIVNYDILKNFHHLPQRGVKMSDLPVSPIDFHKFDLVIVNFVLHHASNNTLFLLEQIRNISSKYILIGEDLSELNYDLKWHHRNYIHQPGGIFRSDEEWQILFKLYNLELKEQYIIHRTDDIDNTHIYRCLYILEKI